MTGIGQAVVSFAAVAGLLTIVPGLDTALVLRTAVTRGRTAAIATGLGVTTGALLWGAAAAAGVSALLTASRLGYDVLRLAGAAYLVWLGLSMLRTAWRRQPAHGPSAPAPTDRGAAWPAWRRGLLTNLLNPKVGAFYVAVLPQFLPASAPQLPVGLLLAGVHAVETMVWFVVIILGAERLRAWLERSAVRRAVDTTTGGVLVGFGLRLGLAGH